MLKAVVNLKTLYDNLEVIKSKTSAKIFAVVKSNAYGHGLSVSTFLQPHVCGFCVATVEEAVKLERLAIHKPIHVLNEGVREFPEYGNIVYTVGALDDLKYIRERKRDAEFYIKINTGMNRQGCRPSELANLMYYVRHNMLNCLGTYTHLYNAEDEIATEVQLSDFKDAITKFGIIGDNHCCASNFLSLPKNSHGDIVRVGLALYGYGNCEGLKPAMSVWAPVIKLHNVRAGENVGYGLHVVDRDCSIATLRIGYGDGYRRLSPGKQRYVLIKDTRCPLVGQVCMDMCMADVSDVSLKVGDEACVLGFGINAEELSQEYGTIVYEVLTSFGERAERVYVYR